MARHRFLTILLALCLTWIAVSTAAADPQRPNVILFLVDDMGWMDSTPYGSRYYETPQMERMARASMRFTDAYATPLCSPTRASILTGQYSARHGILTASGHQPPQGPDFNYLPETAAPNRAMVSPVSKNYLDPSQHTLPKALREAGYRTAHLGKWHLGTTQPHWPDKHGFDVTFHCTPDPGPPNYFSPYGVKPEGRPAGRNKVGTITDGPEGEYITDRLTDEAVKFITANKDRPFFLNLSHYAVHGPWGHKEEYTRQFAGRQDPLGRQGNPIMASMFKSVDESLGRVLDTLDELDLAGNTLLIFFSDNGGNVHSNVPDPDDAERIPPARAGLIQDWRRWAGDLPPTNNAPLRAGKGRLYEGGVRVPLMVRWPGVTQPGSICPEPVHAVDLYPTFLELLGLKPHPDQTIDGVSLVPLLRNPQARLPREAVFNYFPIGGPARPGGVTVRRGDWKLIRWFETSRMYPSQHELYNLRDDLGEADNQAERQPGLVKELDALIDRFLQDTAALVPKPNPAYQPRRSAGPTSPDANRP
jgi:arylsulfatase A-like enzyme